MKKVIITGGSGFIGRNLIPILANYDAEFFLLGRTNPDNYVSSNIHFFECDIFDYQKVGALIKEINPSHLLHIAWSISPSNLGLIENFEWLKASINLFEHFQKNGGKRIICIGSCYEYDWSNSYCNEEITPTRSLSSYSACKNSLREFSEAFCRHFEIELVWPRLFFLFGHFENELRLIPHVITTLLKGQKATIRNGGIFRDYMYAKTAVEKISKLIFNDFTGKVNICSGQPIQLAYIGKQIGEIIGKPDLLKIENPKVDKERVLFGDSRKIENILGIENKNNLKEELSETIDWWRSKIKI